MVPIIQFIFFLLQGGLTILFYLLIAYAITSWLVAFEIINLRNRFAFQIVRTLEKVANTVLWPLRRILPRLGGLDFSVIVAGLLIIGVQTYLLPPFEGFLIGLVSGAPAVTV